mgnify:FL=1
MPESPLTYQWKWRVTSSSEAFWNVFSDTNRLNRDLGMPALIQPGEETETGPNGRFYFQTEMMGMNLEWTELPFEWIEPYGFELTRIYQNGPFKKTRMRFELQNSESKNKGTEVVVNATVVPSGFTGSVVARFQFGNMLRSKLEKIIRQYDEMAKMQRQVQPQGNSRGLSDAAEKRLQNFVEKLNQITSRSDITHKLADYIRFGDELDLQKIKPFALADSWGLGRRPTLEVCLHATRIGMLHFQWDLLCPHCRNASNQVHSMHEMEEEYFCDFCNIDYSVNFDQSVELTFYPSPSVRNIKKQDFCAGGPGITPHIIAQQLLEPGESREIPLTLEPDFNYRLRTFKHKGNKIFTVSDSGSDSKSVQIEEDGPGNDHEEISALATLTLQNETDEEQRIIIERADWINNAVTAARVTSLQVFRDLFSDEALRPGNRIAVGSITIMFTDLLESTKMYREIGDAPAFGYVMDHFDILKRSIEEYDGSMVKTLGDAVMAVFMSPYCALNAIIDAQKKIAAHEAFHPPLQVKAGIHMGRCIAVNLNNTLDYFGSTVNLASRIVQFANGHDIILTDEVLDDPEISEFMDRHASDLEIHSFAENIKGFEQGAYPLNRISLNDLEFPAG